MNPLRHTVRIEDAAFPGDWIELAAFRWFTDAKNYAERASKGDRLDRLVIIENSNRPTYFRNGCEVEA